MQKEKDMWNILVADDEVIERMIVKKILTDYYHDSCRVYEVGNGREAIEAADRYSPQVAVMDISMPGINGMEASMAIKKSHPDCCVIFLTAYDDFEYARQAVSIHAIDYLLKPCSDEELISAVDAALDHYKKYAQFQEWASRPLQQSPYETELTDDKRHSAMALEIISYIKENYRRDLSLHDVAERLHFSEVYFCKFFKNNFNVNFTSYITNLRIDEAKELLKDPDINIKDVGIQVGYPDPNYFAKVFKRITGQSPSDYRITIGS